MSETTIDKLVIEIEGKSSNAASQIDKLAASLDKLKGSSNLTKVSNNLTKLSVGVAALSKNSSGLSNITKLASSLKSLENVGKVSNFSSALTQLKKVPDIVKSLDSNEISQFANKMKSLSAAIAPLATQMNTVSAAFSKLPNRITSCTAAANKLNSSACALSGGFSRFNGGLRSIVQGFVPFSLSLVGVGEVIKSCIGGINDYIEDMNLATVSLGKYSGEAIQYAEKLQDAMGIDMSAFLRNQGVFYSMANGFGLAADKSYQLSKGLTELAYDFSSFYNADMETTFQKLQSGIAGEIEPVRRWGIALDQASMKQWMLKNGIDANVNSLTQADKALVRYNMMVEAASKNGALGDFARTLSTPANALRVLGQQITQCARAIGSVFIPILVQVLPYIQAFVKVVTMAITALAKLFGFKMADWTNADWSTGVGGLADGAEDAAGNLKDAAKQAKKLKDYTLGFDELNIIKPPEDNANSGSGSGASGAGGGLDLDPKSVWDESIFDQIDSKVNELVPKMKVLATAIGAVGLGFLTWKITKTFLTNLAKFLGITPNLKNIGLFAAGAGLAVGGLTLELAGIGDALQNGLNALNSTEILAGGAGIIAGFTLIGKACGSALTGGLIGGVVAGAGMVFVGIRDALTNGLNPLNATMTALGTTIIGAFIGAMFGGPVGALIGAGIGLLVGLIVDGIILIKEHWSEIKEWFSNLWTNIKEGIATGWSNIKNWFSENIPKIIDSVVDWFKKLPGKIGYAIGYVIGKLTAWRDNVRNWISENVPKIIDSVVDWFKKLPGRIFDAICKLAGKISTWASNAKKWFSDNIPKILNNVVDWFAKLPSRIVDVGTNLIKGLWNGIVAAGNWFKNKFFGFFGKIGDIVKEFVGGIGDGYEAGYTSVKKFASGGFPDSGQMFIARESGPELVGTMKGKTAVANNHQIIKGIAQGVYDAVNQAIANDFRYYMQVISTLMSQTKSTVTQAVSDVKSFLKEFSQDIPNAMKDVFPDVTSQLESISSTLENGFSQLSEDIQGLKDALSNIDAPEIETLTDEIAQIGTTIVGQDVIAGQLFKDLEEAGAKPLDAASRKRITIARHAKGGFIEDGLFTMNRGEIAGEFDNGKSVVANNQQIIEGISQGVYEAMLRAGNGNNSDSTEIVVPIYLDGKQVAKVVEKYQKEKGKTLLGSNLGYNW